MHLEAIQTVLLEYKHDFAVVPGEAEAHSLGWVGRVAKLTGTRVLEYSYSHLA